MAHNTQRLFLRSRRLPTENEVIHVSQPIGTVNDGKNSLLVFPRTVFALEVGYRIDKGRARAPFHPADTNML